MTAKRRRLKRRRMRVLVLLETGTKPPDDLDSLTEQERHDFKMETDVLTTLDALGHDVRVLEIKHELAPIKEALEEWKPHVVFNLIEGFFGLRELDQHVVSYLELLLVPYTGCNPRGLVLARDKALAKKVLTYHRVPVPKFDVVRAGRRAKRAKPLTFPMIVKSLTEEASVGIAQASVVWDDAELDARVKFIHDNIGGDALIEEFIDGREIYVGVMGNDRLTVLPPWEFVMTKKDDGTPLIASSRAKWDPRYQRQVGLKTGPAQLSRKSREKLTKASREIYRLLGMSGYARLDYRVTDDEEAYLLEANPNPQIAKDEDFALSAKYIGIDYAALIEQLMRFGMNYVPSRINC